MLMTIIFSSLSLTPSSIVKRDGLLRKQNNANYSRKSHKKWSGNEGKYVSLPKEILTWAFIFNNPIDKLNIIVKEYHGKVSFMFAKP